MMQLDIFKNRFLEYAGSYFQIMTCTDEVHHHKVNFVYISNGDCLDKWRNSGTGELIDILALGTGTRECMAIAENILRDHEVHTIIFPSAGEEFVRQMEEKGVSRVLSGNGEFVSGSIRFVYWSDNGFLSVYHDRADDVSQAELVMGKMAIQAFQRCEFAAFGTTEVCETGCQQWNDCDALNNKAGSGEEKCVGTLILGAGIFSQTDKYMEFIRKKKKRIRTFLFAFNGKSFPQITRILNIRNDRQYCYYLGGQGDAALAAEITLSSPYARYQLLENGYGVCISGCFMKDYL